MATRNERLIPARAVHPGEILREELRERGIKQKDFATMIGVQATHLNEFIHGKRNLNEDFAMKLEKQLGIPFDTWMKLHNGYIYDCKAIEEKATEEQEALAYETECSKNLNLTLLYKRIGIKGKNACGRVAELKAMFPFDLLASQELKLSVSGLYKHSEKVQMDERNALTWLVLNWLQLSKVNMSTEYKQGNAIIAAKKIAGKANSRQINAVTIQKILKDNGIAYIVVEKVEKAPIDAYSTITNGHPAITVTYRYNDMDKLVFDVLHELCHIDRHLSDENSAFVSVEGAEYSKDPKEMEANVFAREMLMSESVWKEILKVGCKSLSPYTIVKTVAKEAERRGISPSIAVSRYKHDTNWYRTSSFTSPKIR